MLTTVVYPQQGEPIGQEQCAWIARGVAAPYRLEPEKTRAHRRRAAGTVAR
jgi:hypothetical protein